MTETLMIEFQGYWHMGSGKSSGADLDAVVRLEDGLPMVPGSHLRGILRHALLELEEHGHAPEDCTRRLFGSGVHAPDARVGLTRFETTQGQVAVGDATLGEQWTAYARTRAGKSAVAHLRRALHSTSLEEGLARSKTLRSVEVAVPMTLRAQVAFGDASDEDREALKLAARFVRGLGANRTRGLGDVELRWEA